MKFVEYKKLFEKEASNSGYSEINIRKCLAYAQPLFENNVPVIYNTSHLAALVGYKKDFIKKAVAYPASYYNQYKIKKKNGSTRIISEPLPSLKEIQTWILRNILENIRVSPYAKAYKRKITIIENLKFHQAQNKVYTLDIKDFFSSIQAKHIERIFLSIGYSKFLSNLLTKLCTKDNQLPQGAPTSPYLSNIFFLDADNLIYQYCRQNSIRYTRYADDLTFSGDFDENKVLKYVTDIIKDTGLSINPEKIVLMKPDQRQIVTGVIVNEKLQVPFHKRNKIRQEVYYIKKFGLKDHIERKGIKENNYLKHLLGKVNFVLHINPDDIEFQDYKNFLIQEYYKSFDI